MKNLIQKMGLMIIVLSATGLYAQEISIKKIWATPDILSTSESVCYYAGDHCFFVSCINGNPTDKDGNGFIANISANGEIIHHKWVDGLNAPKGMGLYNNSLYVTDINRVVQIDISSAKVIKEFKVENAKFLNDIAIDSDGNVYISDMSTNKIHVISDQSVDLWFEDPEIINPNGLLIENKDLVVGTKNGIFSIRISDQKFWHMVKNTGSIDGLKKDKYGNYIISDWSGKVQLVSMEDDLVELLNTTDKGMNAADFEFLAEDEILVIPTFSDNRVVAYEILRK